MECRYAIDAVAARKSQLAHPQAPAIVFVDERNGAQESEVHHVLLVRVGDDACIDGVDDLHVARQQALDQMHGPAFQRFRKQGVIGVGRVARVISQAFSRSHDVRPPAVA